MVSSRSQPKLQSPQPSGAAISATTRMLEINGAHSFHYYYSMGLLIYSLTRHCERSEAISHYGRSRGSLIVFSP